jgi:serine/threonine-protein kinase
MLAGKVPFDRGAGAATLMAHVNDPVPAIWDLNPGAQLSSAVRTIVERCLEKDPERRFASMNDLLVALDDATDDTVDVDLGSADDDGASASPAIEPRPASLVTRPEPAAAARPAVPVARESALDAASPASLATRSPTRKARWTALTWLVVGMGVLVALSVAAVRWLAG